ncbi:unnamed protein product [Plutella xylostella]|uniref:Nuclear pore complex protein Nup85 n=1 Tax=Plutella xylostella TaxID=51655 RepID=A0A8S4D9H9_PLUXY|nr:unnamed protein product [Plutella xylostella]
MFVQTPALAVKISSQTVCAIKSAYHLSGNRIGSALAWAVRGGSARAARRAAQRALLQYTREGTLPAADALLTIGPHMLLADQLVFLAKYCEFHRLYKNRDFKAAGKLLISLLTSKITPDYFWETLLLDTLPLLESDTVIFSAEETCDTMALLAHKGRSLSEEKTELLRLALVRNLARASLAPSEE